MDRTSARGLWRYAEDYAEAGLIVYEKHKPNIFIPAYYLYTHSIELSLKAFLRAKGHSLQQVIDLRHDLRQILAAAKRQDLLSFVPLDEEELTAIAVINPYYRGKELEYIKTGFKRLPQIKLLISCADKLIAGLRPLYFKRRK